MRELLAFLAVLLVPVATTGAVELSVAGGAPGAAAAVRATIEVERTLLDEDRDRHAMLASGRTEAIARLTELYTELDESLRSETPPAPGALEKMLDDVEEAERRRADSVSEERALAERIRDRLRRIGLLEERLAALEAMEEEAAGPLTGTWDVVMLPNNLRGTFDLTQNGTIVSGTYELEGGWSGSLRGTLVNRKIYLERIDSKLGRSAEYQGYLSTDGGRIRGSWSNYELTETGGAGGQWAATRRAER